MSDLPREPEPRAAELIFGERIDRIREFTANLAEQGEELGLIGPAEIERLWSRHIVNCGLMIPLIGRGPVGDVGSGAGLPGLILAIGVPDTQFVLIEPMERRVAWLNQQVRSLGLENVVVLRARAEDVVLDDPLAQVTARAVSALRKLIPQCVPLLRQGGEVIFMKGRSAADEIAAAAKEIARYRLQGVELIELGADVVDEPTRIVRGRLGTKTRQ